LRRSNVPTCPRSIPFILKHLQTHLHNSLKPTLLKSMRSASFPSRRRVYPLFPFRNSSPSLMTQHPSFSFHALTGTHFATPFFSDACRNGGVHPPLHSTFVRFDVQTTLGSRNRARLPRVSSSKRVLAASLFLQGHRRARKKQDHSVSRVPVSFPKQGISSFYTTREKRRMAPGRSGHSWK
jgi:hypothetical protein